MMRKMWTVLVAGALTAKNVRTPEVFVQYHPPASREAVAGFPVVAAKFGLPV
jgi:hypothetical protein